MENETTEIPSVWITKWCLTKGIFEIKDVELCGKSYVWASPRKQFSGGMGFVLGKTAFLLEEEAIEDAKNKRDKKIKSLKKQIKELEKLTF